MVRSYGRSPIRRQAPIRRKSRPKWIRRLRLWATIRNPERAMTKTGTVPVGYRLRVATLDDEPCLRELIVRSIRGLGSQDYTPAQIDAALRGAFGVDTAIIRDKTYFVAVSDANAIAACGGWSKRRTLFGSDERTERDESWPRSALRACQDPSVLRRSGARAARSRPRNPGAQRVGGHPGGLLGL